MAQIVKAHGLQAVVFKHSLKSLVESVGRPWFYYIAVHFINQALNIWRNIKRTRALFFFCPLLPDRLSVNIDNGFNYVQFAANYGF